MKFLRFLLPLVFTTLAFTMSNALFADRRDVDSLHQRDFEAVEDYLISKRTMDVQEKSCNLTISGDVRTEWRHLTEKENGIVLRPSIDARDDIPISKNEFDIVFNLYFDYVCDRAWGVAWVEYDNPAGIEVNDRICRLDPEACGGSGLCDGLCLKKAYMGYNVCCDGETRLDVEVGRRPLWTVFDSRIEFQARFDGLLVRYSTAFDCFGDFYTYLGGFVVDERVNHFGFVTELGLLNIADSGFDFKYSFIYWPKRGRNRCLVHNARGWRFANSQWLVYYNFNPDVLCTSARLYGAILVNHDGQRRFETNNRHRNMGWYLGFIIGEVVLEGDWAVDINYQVVQAQAIADCDVSGIGRGNVLDETFTSEGRGNANYKGWRFEGLYALTDNLVLDTIVEVSRADDKNLGGPHNFSKYELEAIYAF